MSRLNVVRFVLPLGVLTASALATVEAHANGRFPTASQLVIRPGHHDEMALRTTFGVLVSSDGGATWGWICETAVGYASGEDPALSLTGGGAMLASTQEGLSLSSSGGCSWSFAGGGLGKQVVVDSAVHPDAPNAALVVTSTPRGETDAGTPLQTVQLFATNDDAATWAPAGVPLDPTVVPTSVEVAASDSHRVYLTTARGAPPSRAASLFVSTDDGAHWVERAIPVDGAAAEVAYIAAVDPARADRVYVRTAGSSKSRLFVTDDAGAHFSAVYSGGPMLGFALSADGATAYLGGPEDGFQAASTTDLRFVQRSPIPVGCIAVSETRIYVCVVQSSVLVATSDDGSSFAPLLHLSDLSGPLACPAASSAASCAAEWSALRTRFAIGVADAGAAAAPASVAPLPASPLTASGSSCGPHASGRPSRLGTLVLCLGVVGFAIRRRRRRR
jgi:photosystem II stability/assembly factor-like uncharacterized protein